MIILVKLVIIMSRDGASEITVKRNKSCTAEDAGPSPSSVGPPILTEILGSGIISLAAAYAVSIWEKRKKAITSKKNIFRGPDIIIYPLFLKSNCFKIVTVTLINQGLNAMFPLNNENTKSTNPLSKFRRETFLKNKY